MDQLAGADGEPRLFTLTEANALLPRVRELLRRIEDDAGHLLALQQRLETFRAQKLGGAHAIDGESRIAGAVLREANRLSELLRGYFGELTDLGCEVKDVQQGLVDFRALRHGRTVYLCWKLGEDDIRFWHELDAGFAGRRPL